MPNFKVFNSILWNKKSDKKDSNKPQSSNKMHFKPVMGCMEPIKLQIELPYQQYFTDSTETECEKMGKTTKRYSRKRNKSIDRGTLRIVEESVDTRAKSNTISLHISFDAPVYNQAKMSSKVKPTSSASCESSTSGYSSSDYKETVSSDDGANTTKLSPILTSIVKNKNVKKPKKSSKNDHIYDQLNSLESRSSIESPSAKNKSESRQQVSKRIDYTDNDYEEITHFDQVKSSTKITKKIETPIEADILNQSSISVYESLYNCKSSSIKRIKIRDTSINSTLDNSSFKFCESSNQIDDDETIITRNYNCHKREYSVNEIFQNLEMFKKEAKLQEELITVKMQITPQKPPTKHTYVNEKIVKPRCIHIDV